MIGKVKKLPESTQQILRLAACVGASFDLNTLSIISEKSSAEIFLALTPALQSGLILPLSELDEELLIQDYKFRHDRVQQAAYALIDEAQRTAVHLQIGRLLLQNTSPDALSDEIFKIVDHLNIGSEFISNQEEQIELVNLNLLAGKKAKNATAYAAALQYLSVAMSISTGDIWSDHYDLALALHKERALVEYLNGYFDKSETFTQLIISRAKSVIDQADAYNLPIIQYTLMAQYSEAFNCGRKALKLLGILIPEADEDIDKLVQEEQNAINQKILNQEILSFIDLKEITKIDKKVALKLLSNMIAASYIFNQSMYGLTVSKIVNISLEYGNSPESPFGYSCYGLLESNCKVRKYQAGYQFGLLALNLSDKLNNLSEKCKTSYVLANYLNSWVKPLKDAEFINNQGYQAGLESGELQFAGYIVGYKFINSFYQGVKLEQVLAEFPKLLTFLEKNKNHWANDLMLGVKLVVLNLLGLTDRKLDFDARDLSEAQYLQSVQEHTSIAPLCNYYSVKSQVLYLYGYCEEVLKLSLKIEENSNFIRSIFVESEYSFYTSLSLTALYNKVSEFQQETYRKNLESSLEIMKVWADNCPDNFLHKYLLISAEVAHILGKDLEAIDLYDQAIESARKNGFIQHEALGYELAAKFWLGKGKEEIAQLYMKKAHYGYQLWGAKRKVEDLEEKYSQLLPLSSAVSCITFTQTITSNTPSGTGSSEALDLATVMKASLAISGEIVLDKLLASLMKILIENAGAQIGFLILEKAGQWVIEASGNVNSDNVTVLQSIPIDQHLPLSLINYVARTRETVVKNDAAQQGKFTNDSYIKNHQTKSILCTPLINQGQLSGIVYLENNLTTGVFTPDRLKVIQLLSGQAAIAITNAKLYAEVKQAQKILEDYNRTLERQVTERTEALQDKNQQLAATLEQLQLTQKKLVESEKMASLGGLVAGVSHEINTPVGIGITAASLLADKTTEFFELYKSGKMKRSQLEKFLDTAMQSSTMVLSNLNRAADLIQSFKQVAVDQSTEDQRTLNLKQYLSETLIPLRAKLRTTHHQVEIRGDDAISLFTYPGALSQIITNLVMNSLTHAYSLEDAGHLVFDVKQEGEQVLIKYTDDGKGIPKENLSKIFDPFFTTKRGQGGSGLGLHI
ncbi:MAG: GAF domain-containing protein, partial [Nostoc sp. C3-bin3]|nr:GAF domain-containing protein [Nostoc sp. C3-bin3]